jgi:hypothetical protein
MRAPGKSRHLAPPPVVTVTLGGEGGLLARIVILGAPCTKKTSPTVMQLIKDASGKMRRLGGWLEDVRVAATAERRGLAEIISGWASLLPEAAALDPVDDLGLRMAAAAAGLRNPRGSGALVARHLGAALGEGGTQLLVLPSPDYREVAKRLVPALAKAWKEAGAPAPLGSQGEGLSVNAQFVLGPRQAPDATGLYDALADLLQESGIIENDRRIEHWDGSRRIRDDRSNPRTEVSIWRAAAASAQRSLL